jgi:hypothetical protein
MNITIKFNTDNAAFEDFESEINFIFEQIKKKISHGNRSIIDSNGNTVGTIIID